MRQDAVGDRHLESTEFAAVWLEWCRRRGIAIAVGPAGDLSVDLHGADLQPLTEQEFADVILQLAPTLVCLLARTAPTVH